VERGESWGVEVVIVVGVVGKWGDEFGGCVMVRGCGGLEEGGRKEGRLKFL
jgi:hypothetical protein